MRFISAGLFLLMLLTATANAERSEDIAEILAAHAAILQAHRDNDVDLLMNGAAEEYTLVTRGEVVYPTIGERAARFAEYFGMTEFSKYEDSIPPIVQVSEDGSLAWLIARVSVSGIQTVGEQEHSLDFVSAWIELYEKRDGHWVQTGNVSNFKQ